MSQTHALQSDVALPWLCSLFHVAAILHQKALEDSPASTYLHVNLELTECELEGYGPFKELQVAIKKIKDGVNYRGRQMVRCSNTRWVKLTG